MHVVNTSYVSFILSVSSSEHDNNWSPVCLFDLTDAPGSWRARERAKYKWENVEKMREREGERADKLKKVEQKNKRIKQIRCKVYWCRYYRGSRALRPQYWHLDSCSRKSSDKIMQTADWPSIFQSRKT